jgi:hypothetical protein
VGGGREDWRVRPLRPPLRPGRAPKRDGDRGTRAQFPVTAPRANSASAVGVAVEIARVVIEGCARAFR